MEGRAKGSRPLVLTDPTLLVRRANERLVMLREGKQVAAVPIADLSHVAVHGPVTLTGAAVAGLLDAGVDVTLYSSAGFYRGTLASAQSKNVYLMLAQVDAWRRDERRVAFARGLLAGKIAGQRSVLHRQARDRGSAACREAAERLKVLERLVDEEETVDGARGVEGAAAAAYFNAFGEMLSEGWAWKGRVHRPATDPVNAMLSFGYALATGEVVRLLTWGGFDTRVGLVHGLRYGRESLALDLVEEFRAPMVDRFVLKLLNRREFQAGDFEEREDGAYRLTPDGRRRFLEAWEGLLTERTGALRNELPLPEDEMERTPERMGPPEAGAEAGAGATWRGRMERQVHRLRRFMMKEEAYVPLLATRRTGAAARAGRTAGTAGTANGRQDGSQREADADEVPEEP